MHHVNLQIASGHVQLKDLQLDNDVRLLVSASYHHDAILTVCTPGNKILC
jgi:hypothetical protein